MNNEELVKSGMEITESLCIAIQNAGGNVEKVLKDLENKTAKDFISMLSTNNIRFTYKGGIKNESKN